MLNRILPLIIAFTVISCGQKNEQNQEVSNVNSQPDILKEELIKTETPSAEAIQIGFIKLDQAAIDSLHPQLKVLHTSIARTSNYASGITLAELMGQVNSYLNSNMENKFDEKQEAELNKAMNSMTVNPRETSQHFNHAGRMLMRKIYIYQEEKDPKLAGQVRDLKIKLGKVDPKKDLTNQHLQVKDFIHQCFVILYLIQEDAPLS